MAEYPQTLDEFTGQLNVFLHGDKIGILKDVFQKIEREFEVRRLNIALGFLACLALFFLASDGGHFLCNFIGFAYPACVIIWTVEQDHTQLDTKKWLTYWTIFNTFIFVEYFLVMQSYFWRLYSLLKCVFLCLCFLPVPWNWSQKLYNHYVQPFLQIHQDAVEEHVEYVWRSINKGVPVFLLLYCIYIWGFQFLCNILGFVLPAYISMVFLMNEREIESNILLTYWIVYSSACLSEYFLSAIPLYYLMKFVVLGVYVVEPSTQQSLYHHCKRLVWQYKPMNYANILCQNVVHFFLASHQSHPDPRVNQINRQTSGVPTLWNITPRMKHHIRAQQAVVDPQEVELQLSSPMVKAVLEMDIKVELVKKAIKLKLACDGPGHNFTSAEELMEAVFNLKSNEIEEEGSSVDTCTDQEVKDLLSIPHSLILDGDHKIPQEVIEENRQLKDQRLCKICMTEEVEMIFVPCGHLVCCYSCAIVMTYCPICRIEIDRSMRAYMS